MQYLYHLRDTVAAIAVKDCRYSGWSTTDTPLAEREWWAQVSQPQDTTPNPENSLISTFTASTGWELDLIIRVLLPHSPGKLTTLNSRPSERSKKLQMKRWRMDPYVLLNHLGLLKWSTLFYSRIVNSPCLRTIQRPHMSKMTHQIILAFIKIGSTFLIVCRHKARVKSQHGPLGEVLFLFWKQRNYTGSSTVLRGTPITQDFTS